MFPHLRQTVLARADVLVELVTLGEYGLDERGAPMPLGCADPPPEGVEPRPAAEVASGPTGVQAPRTDPTAVAERTPSGAFERRRDRCTPGAGRCVSAARGAAPARS